MVSKMMRVGILFGLVSISTAKAFTLNGSSGLHGWSKSTITFSVNYSGCSAFQDTLNTKIDAAFALWNSVSTSGAKLVRGGTSTTSETVAAGKTASSNVTDSPVIICASAMKADMDILNPGVTNDSSNIPGITKIDVDNNLNVNYAAIFLNFESGKAANIQTLNSSNPALVGVVLAHEIGHALGLGHSSDSTSLMYYNASAKLVMSLAQDDMDGITFLYPRSEFGSGFMGCGTVVDINKESGPPPSEAILAGIAEFLLFLLFCIFVRKPTLCRDFI